MVVESAAAESAWHFTPADINALHSQPADYRINYGSDPLQFADLRLPKGRQGPYPVVIIIHGGCWMSKFADLQNTAALAFATDYVTDQCSLFAKLGRNLAVAIVGF